MYGGFLSTIRHASFVKIIILSFKAFKSYYFVKEFPKKIKEFFKKFTEILSFAPTSVVEPSCVTHTLLAGPNLWKSIS